MIFLVQIFRSVFLDLPVLIFFSTYTLLVLFWAEIYHQVSMEATAVPLVWDGWAWISDLYFYYFQANHLPTERLRPIFLGINGTIYFIQVTLGAWNILWLYRKKEKMKFEESTLECLYVYSCFSMRWQYDFLISERLGRKKTEMPSEIVINVRVFQSFCLNLSQYKCDRSVKFFLS